MEDDWREKKPLALQQFKHMQENGILTDCTFVVGCTGEKFECHKLVLARASFVFEAMLFGPMAERKEIVVEDIQADTFKHLINYIYCDTLSIETSWEALGLCYAASKYMMSNLVVLCTDFLCCHLEANYLWRALELANLIENKKLYTKCIAVMQSQTEEVVTTPDFDEISQSALQTLMEQDQLNVTSEMTMINAAIRWGCKEAARKNISVRNAVGPEILSTLRFLSLSPDKINKCTNLTLLITEHEKRCILSNLTPSTKFKIPTEFNNSKLCRNYVNKTTYKLDRTNLNRSCTVISSYGHLKCSLDFYSNKNLWFQGFEVFTQCVEPSSPPVPKKCKTKTPSERTYSEEIAVSLLKISFNENKKAEILSMMNFKSKVNYNTTSKIMLPKPIYLEFQDKVHYCIRMTFYCTGRYPIKDLWSMMDYGNVKFVFAPSNFDTFSWGHGGIVAAIHFFADGVIEPPPPEYVPVPQTRRINKVEYMVEFDTDSEESDKEDDNVKPGKSTDMTDDESSSSELDSFKSVT